MTQRRHTQQASLPSQTLVLDNGSHTIKAGLVSGSSADPDDSPGCRIIPNCLARSRDRKIYVGSEVGSCLDFGELTCRRPMDRGSIVQWETQREIWDREFFGKGDDRNGQRWNIDPSITNLVLTETPTPLPTLSTFADQIVFEEFGFAGYVRTTPGVLIARNGVQRLFGGAAQAGDDTRAETEAMKVDAPAAKNPSPARGTEVFLLVDAGFSSTHITAYINGAPINKSTRRLDVGGNFLTNYLKEIVSIRHYNMMDEEYTINAIKEDVCYVSDDFRRDMELSWKPDKRGKRAENQVDTVTLDYVLPDWNEGKRGFSRPHISARQRAKQAAQNGGVTSKMLEEEIMTLSNERFTVPELLFSPGNVGLNQAGIPGAIMEVVQSLPDWLQAAMVANVVLVGGCSLFPGFQDRVEKELRMRVPEELEVRVGGPDTSRAISLACESGMSLAKDANSGLHDIMVTKQEYEENGAQWAARVFAGKAR